jgi:hypothetical protein
VNAGFLFFGKNHTGKLYNENRSRIASTTDEIICAVLGTKGFLLAIILNPTIKSPRSIIMKLSIIQLNVTQ